MMMPMLTLSMRVVGLGLVRVDLGSEVVVGREGIIYIIHRPSKIMHLRTRLPTLLQLRLQPTKNMDRTSA